MIIKEGGLGMTCNALINSLNRDSWDLLIAVIEQPMSEPGFA